MAVARNIVIAGKYAGKKVSNFLSVQINNQKIKKSDIKELRLENVSTPTTSTISGTSKKSATSSLGRGLIGGALFGPVGAVAGVATAKSKVKLNQHIDGVLPIFYVTLVWDSGEESLLEIDDNIYTELSKIANGEYDVVIPEKKPTVNTTKNPNPILSFLLILSIFMLVANLTDCSNGDSTEEGSAVTETSSYIKQAITKPSIAPDDTYGTAIFDAVQTNGGTVESYYPDMAFENGEEVIVIYIRCENDSRTVDSIYGGIAALGYDKMVKVFVRDSDEYGIEGNMSVANVYGDGFIYIVKESSEFYRFFEEFDEEG